MGEGFASGDISAVYGWIDAAVECSNVLYIFLLYASQDAYVGLCGMAGASNITVQIIGCQAAFQIFAGSTTGMSIVIGMGGDGTCQSKGVVENLFRII